MVELILVAIPFFVVFIGLEVASLWLAPDDREVGYDARDTATSLSMGAGNLLFGVGYRALSLVVFAGLYLLTPLRWPTSQWWARVLLFLADDVLYYWYHRAHHEVRLLWAAHVVHHSSQYFNLSTALRQPWMPFAGIPFWTPLALLGVPPWAIFLQQSISLLYQFFLHTERIDKLPRAAEWLLNTPSHHRVHHGMNDAYLDRNYGGVLIVWDRLFRTFAPEGERVHYGLTSQLRSHNPVVVATHEYLALWRDLRADVRWRDRWGHLARGPGWCPGPRPDRP